MKIACLGAILAACLATGAAADPPAYDERPAKLVPATEGWSYERRVAEVAMRDGVKLHTVILIPKGAKDAPILLTRTPYSADLLTANVHSGNLIAVLDGYDNAADIIVAGGYIRVIQDVRGKYGSAGDYVMNRPLVGAAQSDQGRPCHRHLSTPSTGSSKTSRKPMARSAYTVSPMMVLRALMGLFHPHPALKAAIPINSMVDGWMGDDWFHYGAFRQMHAYDYAHDQQATRGSDIKWWSDHYDDLYDTLARGRIGRRHGQKART
jgi:predicted acyl esterase